MSGVVTQGGEVPLLDAVPEDYPSDVRFRSSSWATAEQAAVQEETDLADIRYGHSESKLMRNAWESVAVDLDAWILLFLLGMLTAVVGYSVDSAVVHLQSWRFDLLNSAEGFIARYVIWIIYPLALTLAGFFFCQYVSVDANGSGIPQMKAILSGVAPGNTLSFRTLVSKCVGLACALGSGLTVGKEGPFVHIASCIGALLARIPMFNRIRRYETLYLQILAAGVSVGVSSTFGAPVGGVLFAIEVTRVYFLVSNYWMGFFCAACGAFFYHITKGGAQFKKEMGGAGIVATDFGIHGNYEFYELFIFCLLGAVLGLISAAWVQLNARVWRFRSRVAHRAGFDGSLERMGWPLVVAVTLVTAVMTYPFFLGKYMALDDITLANSLFGPLKATGGEVSNQDGWQSPSIFVTLFFVFVWKFTSCLVSITLPLPCGMYMPMFATGAVFGRFVGEFVHIFDSSVIPGGYALVGAAAMAGGVTRTISSAVIVFEVTGELRHILPVLLAVLISIAVGNLFSLNIYDSIANMRQIPSLASLRKTSSYKLLAKNVMDQDVKFITRQVNASDIIHCLQTSPHQEFAVVESVDNPQLLGTVERQLLEGFIYQFKKEGSTGGKVSIPELDLRRKESATPRMTGANMYRSTFDPDNHDSEMNVDVVLSATTGLGDAGSVIGHIPYSAPHQVVQGATLPDVLNQFIMLGMHVTYVTSGGRIVGVISRDMLIDAQY